MKEIVFELVFVFYFTSSVHRQGKCGVIEFEHGVGSTLLNVMSVECTGHAAQHSVIQAPLPPVPEKPSVP